MLLKVGTNFEPHEKLLPVLRGVELVFKQHQTLMIITSMKDREHSPGSKHYVGKAFDLRIKHVTNKTKLSKLFTDIEDAIFQHGAVIIQEPTHWHIQVN